MQSKTSSESLRQGSPAQKPLISETSETLTPSELAQLQRESKEAIDFALKVFSGKESMPPRPNR